MCLPATSGGRPAADSGWSVAAGPAGPTASPIQARSRCLRTGPVRAARDDGSGHRAPQVGDRCRRARMGGPAGDGLWHTAGMDAGLRVHQGGSGEPVLLQLHGLGATGDVWQGWRPLLARRWPGRWLAPDLPGHGGSPPLSSYTFQSLAAAVAGIAGAGARTVVLGHSLGGVVGLALAGGGFDVPV